MACSWNEKPFSRSLWSGSSLVPQLVLFAGWYFLNFLSCREKELLVVRPSPIKQILILGGGIRGANGLANLSEYSVQNKR